MPKLIDVLMNNKRAFTRMAECLRRLEDLIWLEKATWVPVKVTYAFNEYPVRVEARKFSYNAPQWYEDRVEDYFRVYMIEAVLDEDPNKELLEQILKSLLKDKYREFEDVSRRIVEGFYLDAYGEVENDIQSYLESLVTEVYNEEIDRDVRLSITEDSFEGYIENGDRKGYIRQSYEDYRYNVSVTARIDITMYGRDTVFFGIDVGFRYFDINDLVQMTVEVRFDEKMNIERIGLVTSEPREPRAYIAGREFNLEDDIGSYEYAVLLALYPLYVTASMLEYMLDMVDFLRKNKFDFEDFRSAVALLFVFP